jgi:hypothetical protein
MQYYYQIDDTDNHYEILRATSRKEALRKYFDELGLIGARDLGVSAEEARAEWEAGCVYGAAQDIERALTPPGGEQYTIPDRLRFGGALFAANPEFSRTVWSCIKVN